MSGFLYRDCCRCYSHKMCNHHNVEAICQPDCSFEDLTRIDTDGLNVVMRQRCGQQQKLGYTGQQLTVGEDGWMEAHSSSHRQI